MSEVVVNSELGLVKSKVGLVEGDFRYVERMVE